MKKLIWIIVVVVALVLVFVVSSKNKEEKSKHQVAIGGLFALSGYASFAGEASRDGFLMAMEDAGFPTNYTIEDFGSDPKRLVSAAEKLINVNGVIAIIGPEWAEFGEVVVPLAEKNKTLFISPWMVSEEKWLESPYYYSGTPSERNRHKAMIEHMVRKNVKNVVIVYSNNTWSLGNVRIFKEELQKQNGVAVLAEFKFNQDETDYRTEILKIKQLNPDAIYSVIATDDSHGIFSKQLSELSAKYQVYIDNSRGESPVMRERFLQYVTGQIYPAPKEYKNNAAFLEKYENKFGYKAGAISAAVSYDMTTLVLDAIRKGAKTATDIQEYLNEVSKYEGFSGEITFNKDGQVVGDSGGVEIRQITRDGFIKLEN